MTGFIHEIRRALRTIRSAPTVGIVAILTIAVGVGANTTIFGWIRSLLLNPIPGATEPARVVALENTAPDGTPITTSYLDFRDFRDNLKLVRDVSAYRGTVFSVGDAPKTERVWGQAVTGGMFDMLGVRPAVGRFFSLEERDDRQNVHAVAVISHGYWKSNYKSDPAVIGKTLRINGTLFAVIGVAPEGFHGTQAGLDYNLWVPLTMAGQLTHTGTWMLEDRNTRNYMLMARLAPGVTIEQARAELQALANRMAVADADSNQGIGATVLPVWQSHFSTQATLLTPVSILMGAGGVVLLIVCANLANLLLVRATGRMKEFSIRLALGAKPRQVAAQLFTETLLLASAGACGGLFLANWLSDALRWLLPAVSAPALLAAPLDGQVFAFTALLAVLVAVLASLVPALHASHTNINEVLKQSGRSGTTSAHSNRLRGLLVISEMALAVVALVGAGLFTKSFQSARAVDPGFSPDGVALAQFDFSTTSYSALQVDSFGRRLKDRLEQLPGVTAASYDDSPQLGFHGGNWETLEVEGYVPGRNENMKIYRDLISPGYFASLRIPIVEGRDFDWRDDSSSQKVMIVNQAFVRRFLPHRLPIGVKVHGWGQWFTIVGIARDSKYHRVTEAPEPYFYIPIRQIFRPEYGLTFHVRTSGSVNEAMQSLRTETAAIDPALTIFDAEPMTEYIAASLFGAKIAATLLSVLSGVGLLLAAMGLYGVLAYSVAQRTQEIGLRMALGAGPAEVFRMVVGQGLQLTLAGVAAGTGIALVLGRSLASLLYGVKPADPLTFAGVWFVLTVIALLACAIPVRRATRIDPMVALRYE
jgi:predicted permease